MMLIRLLSNHNHAHPLAATSGWEYVSTVTDSRAHKGGLIIYAQDFA